MKTNCPVCKSDETQILLKRYQVPVHQNVLFDTQEEARSILKGNLSIAICQNCSFVFNADFSSSLMNYNQDYENTQSYSSMFEEYINDIVNYLVHERGLYNSKVVEVGCGKGIFLKKLVEEGNNIGIGFDPSYVGPLVELSGRLNFYKEFFDENSINIAPEFVICRHVIEHLYNPVDMLKSINRAVQSSEKVQVFFETPDVDWIFENQVVWDFFYEHCSLFNAQSVRIAFQRAGFYVDTVKKIFGGQYLWVEAHPASKVEPFERLKDTATLEIADNFKNSNAQIEKRWREQLIELSQNGKLILWGAGAKGVTFANLFDAHRKLIQSIVDVNPNKQGKYLSGTGHPIISPSKIKDIYNNEPIIVLVLNPNYKDEISEMLRENQVKKHRLVEFSIRN